MDDCQTCGVDMPRAAASKKYCSPKCKATSPHRKARDARRYASKTKEEKAEHYRHSVEWTVKHGRKASRQTKELERLRGMQGRGTHVCWIDDRRAKAMPSQADMDRLAEVNARQAYRYWIMVKAPSWIIDAMYSDRPWRNPRLSESEKYRVRYRSDSVFQVNERIRRQMKKATEGVDIAGLMRQAMKNKGKSPTIERLLGYTIKDLASHLEGLFAGGMTWDRFMRGEIHIDHKIPRKVFDMNDEADFKACWSLDNLQPLWAIDNRRKSAKLNWSDTNG